jgi:hypothetical protein
MKNALPLFLLSTFVGLTLFTACGSNKKLQASKAQVEQLKKDSIETHRKLENEKKKTSKVRIEKSKQETVQTPLPVNDNNTNPVVKKKSTSPIATSEVSKPLPPKVVANIFKTKYPTATEVIWTRRMPIVNVKNKNTRDYKAHFVIENKNNSVIYTENGTLIETREQILPDQLPPNIYAAIKSKYPDSNIVSAATIKNSKIQGSFIAVIKMQTEEKELMLLENGTFVD